MSKYLKHYNHNHDALGRFAGSNTAKTVAKNELLISANKDMSNVYNRQAKSYDKKASKYSKKIEKKKKKNKDFSKDEKKFSELKKEGQKYTQYKANVDMEVARLESQNKKMGEEFSKLVENSIFLSIKRDERNRITSVDYHLTPDDDVDSFGKEFQKFNRDLMSGKANTMSDEQLLRKYKRRR